MTGNGIVHFHRASRCADASCVEVARDGPEVLMRDSKDVGGPVLRFSGDQWRSFQAALRAGTFDSC
jgi:hypothetical protein